MPLQIQEKPFIYFDAPAFRLSFKPICSRFCLHDSPYYLLLFIFNIQGCDGPPPDLSAYRGHFTEDTEQCGSFGSNGTYGPRPKRQRASGASSSDKVSSRSEFKGLFFTPLTKASRRALLRAMVVSLAQACHLYIEIEECSLGWCWTILWRALASKGVGI
jgi:hypothetical protein